ncbi:hypothetical protein [Wenzhouxiangella sp. EGI_FJ10305]|uniref:hypothetical protein n=1 Tax=Wenzhouxiangella sp. EGI_FJ10305 TaxID=3243768 RepID=UPI0035E214FB
MKNIPALFILGSVGVVVTALIHILVASLTENASLALWLPLYVVWMVFMAIGLAQIRRAAYPK